MKWVLPVTFLFFVFGCGSKPETNNIQNKDSIIKVPVRKDSLRRGLMLPKQMALVRKSAYDDFYVRIKDSAYFCNYKGKMQSADTLGNRVNTLFNLNAEYLIDKVYFLPINNNQFYVSWQETDHKGVYTYFALFDRGNDTPVWKRSIKAHSPGQPVIDSDNVYISSLGMIGKVGLYSGELIWQHDSLFDPLSLKYKAFNQPLLYTHSVCFFDFPIVGKKGKADTIWVNDVSGKLIR